MEWWPKWLYEVKPYLIFAAGVWAGSLDHPIKWIAVAALLATAIFITVLRMGNRRRSSVD